ncbi:MAG: hypothetical protein V3T23_04930, partial [Nitrososphaerales archaeon]
LYSKELSSTSGLGQTQANLALVIESPVAKRVTATPFATRPSARLLTINSQLPYFLGGVLQ